MEHRATRRPGRSALRDYFAQYAAVAGVGFVVAFLVILALTSYLGRSDPSTLLSFQSDDWPGNAGRVPDPAYSVGVHYFGDFLPTWRQSRSGSPYMPDGSLWPSNYLPTTHVLLRPFTWIPYHAALFGFLALSAAAIIVPMWVALRSRPGAHRALLLVSGVVLTAPFISVLDRGNIQGLVSGLVIAAALLLAVRRDLVAATLIGLAAALKGYPILLVIILMRRRRWTESLVALGTFVGLTILSLLTFTGGIAQNLRALWAATTPFRNTSVGQEAVVPAHNNSLYALLQVLDAADLPGADFLLSHYSLVAVALTVMVVLLASAPRATLAERLFALTGAMVLLPTITGAYALTLLFAPLAILARRGSRPWPLPTAYALTCGLIMVPKAFPTGDGSVTVASVINPLLVLLLLGIISAAAFHRHNRPSGVVERTMITGPPSRAPRSSDDA